MDDEELTFGDLLSFGLGCVIAVAVGAAVVLLGRLK